jgi:hypothetical protein
MFNDILLIHALLIHICSHSVVIKIYLFNKIKHWLGDPNRETNYKFSPKIINP